VSLDVERLRRFLPLIVFAAAVGVGWMVFVRPLSAEHAQGDGRLEALRLREAELRGMVGESRSPAVSGDPADVFDTRVASGDPTAAIVERLAQLASDSRARDLFIETVEAPTEAGVPPMPAAHRPDPRFSLFDRQLTYATVRMAFEIDYAGLGRFLWNLRDLPSVVEIRALNVQPPPPAPGGGPRATDGVLRVTMTLYAYSRTSAAAAGRAVP
jgi:hypothetical protein